LYEAGRWTFVDAERDVEEDDEEEGFKVRTTMMTSDNKVALGCVNK